MTKARSAPADEFAAVDLGSHSFHMVVARQDEGALTVIDRVREMVQLGSGLDSQNCLRDEASGRALQCLPRFGERLHGMAAANVRVVGTNSLRKASNAHTFIKHAETVLGFPIDIISGIEEARLIYLGVSQTLQADQGRRLVIDIGGGSTEIIVGENSRAEFLESIDMGCVSTSQRFFPDGEISQMRMREAIMAANVELEPHVARFLSLQWQDVIGSSGTARAIERVVREFGWSDAGITRTSVEQLVDLLVNRQGANTLDMPGLGDRRRTVFAGGVALMAALFRSLSIERMRISDGSLREGVLADLIGRGQSRDTRAESVIDIIRRYHIDQAQADRVKNTANHLFLQVQDSWHLSPRDGQLLAWAAQLHEIGLLISYGQYHKHGAYMLANLDIAGFSRQEQESLSVLVRMHRKKFQEPTLHAQGEARLIALQRLAILLRLAVVFNRGRCQQELPRIMIEVDGNAVTLSLGAEWLAAHALTRADLDNEQDLLQQKKFLLRVKEI